MTCGSHDVFGFAQATCVSSAHLLEVSVIPGCASSWRKASATSNEIGIDIALSFWQLSIDSTRFCWSAFLLERVFSGARFAGAPCCWIAFLLERVFCWGAVLLERVFAGTRCGWRVCLLDVVSLEGNLLERVSVRARVLLQRDFAGACFCQNAFLFEFVFAGARFGLNTFWLEGVSA